MRIMIQSQQTNSKHPLYWHVHHDILFENLKEPIENRIAFIQRWKPIIEIETRLRLMKPIQNPDIINTARTEYKKSINLAKIEYYYAQSIVLTSNSTTALDVLAGEKYETTLDTIQKDYETIVNNLHELECSNCPWNGHTIFPSVIKQSK